MTRTRLIIAVVGAALSLAGATPGLAQGDLWATATYADPFRWNSLPLDATQAVTLRPGEWQVGNASSYANVWQLTWHTPTIHREFRRQGEPVASWELRKLEERHPGDTIYHVDLEAWRTDLVFARGFDGGLVATARLPWIEVGAPHWDKIAENFHERFGLTSMSRELFPRGQTLVYVKGLRGHIERREELDGTGFGDVTLSLAGPLGRWAGAEHRWVATVQAPTGKRDSLFGSGGWDTGVRWFATWGSGPRQGRLAVGYTFLDARGDWLGIKRANTWHALGEVMRPLGRDWTVRASARFDSSPLADFAAGEIGRESFYLTVGVRAPVGKSGWAAFDVGENFPSMGLVPDWTFHLQFGARFGAGTPAR